MGFVAGVMRLFGVVDDYSQDEQMLEYPVQHRGSVEAYAPQPAEPSRAGLLAAMQSGKYGAQPVEAQAPPRVINMPQPDKQTVFIVRPTLDGSGKPGFSMKTYAGYLLTRQALVLDVNELAALDLDEATRVVDYLSGVVEAVEGSVWEVAKNIFIFAPNNVALAGDPLKPLEVY
jgi:FtsZ-interacting cell division protein YlmF